MRCITAPVTREGWVVPFLREVGLEFLIGHMQRHVWDDGGVVQVERLIFVFTNKRQRLLVDAVRCVILPLEDIVAARVTGVRSFG